MLKQMPNQSAVDGVFHAVADSTRRWIAERRSLWERRLDRLGQVLADDDGRRPPTPKKAKEKP
jgi:hypothetical protein